MDKLTVLREQFEQNNIDGFLITNSFNRRYITGFTGTTGVAIISKECAKFITDFRYVEQAVNQVKGFQIIENRSTLQEVAKQAEKMGIERLGFEQEDLNYKQYKDLNNLVQKCIPVSGIIEGLRAVKTDNEVKKINTAANISDKAFEHILNFIRPGITEMEINHELEHHMRKNGATSSSFDIIIASGIRSALPHGVASNKKVEKGDMLTLDFGAYYEGYCSDMTRTIAVGEPNDDLKQIYSIVYDALEIGINSIKAGSFCQAIDKKVRDFITEKGFGKQFRHGTGHAIGLEVHESPYFSVKSEDVLKENMVMTVEPGIYLPGIGGVRIEDDILVKKNGSKVLTHANKELIIL
ncbi:M24 family metallopeptidase [Virgibacillus alimentarius]|uniref:Xaa-Pro aminopeptidase n=1 Tax=Virgibacillus alimentarius TaxID=698769 RepID=A0ABS4S851_9BACI|nr:MULTISPECIES: Xaa-Pro peptidase family protein [Virgibacillus]MBP2257670.1 Xaa-Pro aminopeptidase [Virgibacillus alimentarius]HLR69772.1 Xaa-Pro peptidase family protein [Virgibacillus sp.]